MSGHTETVHTYLLAVQTGNEKGLSVMCVRDQFFVKRIGKPCWDADLATFDDVYELRDWIEQHRGFR